MLKIDIKDVVSIINDYLKFIVNEDVFTTYLEDNNKEPKIILAAPTTSKFVNYIRRKPYVKASELFNKVPENAKTLTNKFPLTIGNYMINVIIQEEFNENALPCSHFIVVLKDLDEINQQFLNGLASILLFKLTKKYKMPLRVMIYGSIPILDDDTHQVIGDMILIKICIEYVP